MSRRIAVAVVMVATSYLTLMAVAGENRFSGRLLFVVSSTHGVHAGDLLPLTAWLVVAVCCAALWRRPD